MAFPTGPLTAFKQPEGGTQLESSFMPQYALSAPSNAEQLDRLRNKVAPDEEGSSLSIIKQAKDRLLAQSTGVDPLISWLAAYGSADPRNKLGAAAQAMTQAVGQQAASKQKLDLDVLQLDLAAAEKREAIEKARLEREAKEPNRKLVQIIKEDGGVTTVDANTKEGFEAIDAANAEGLKVFDVGTRPVERETVQNVKGFTVSGEPVTQNNIEELYYLPAAFGKIQAALKGTIDTIAGAKKTLDLIDENPEAFSNWRTIQSGMPPQLQSIVPEKWNKLTESQREVRARVFNQASAYIKNLYGVAVSGREKEMLRTFLPTTDDNLDTLIPKLLSAYKISLESINNADSEMLQKTGSKNLDYVLELAANPYKKKEKLIPQMTEDEAENKRVYDSLNEGDKFLTLKGKEMTK